MENAYLALKHSHITFVVISLILFNFRVYKLVCQPQTAVTKIWKIVPHINDTFLLITGVIMAFVAHWQPFGAHIWLGVKLGLVVAYILLGARCLKSVPRSKNFWLFHVLAMSVIGIIVFLARFKPI